MDYTLILYELVFSGEGENRIPQGTNWIAVKIDINWAINNGYNIQINKLRAPYHTKDGRRNLVDFNVKDQSFTIGVDEANQTEAKSYNHVLSLLPERCEPLLLDPQPQSNKVYRGWRWFGSDLATSNGYRTKFDGVRGNQVEQVNLLTGRRVILALETLLLSSENVHAIFEQSVYNNCHIVANENNDISADAPESMIAVFCDENYKAQAVYYFSDTLGAQGANGTFFYSPLDGLVYNSQRGVYAHIGYEQHEEDDIQAAWSCISISQGRIFAFQVNGIALYRLDGTVLDFRSYGDLNIDFEFDPNNEFDPNYTEDDMSLHDFEFSGPPIFLKYFPYFDLVLEKTLNQPIRFWHLFENKFQRVPIQQDCDFKQYSADSILVKQSQQWMSFCFQELSMCLFGITDLVRLISSYIV